MKFKVCCLLIGLPLASLAQTIIPAIASYKFSGLTSYYHPGFLNDNGPQFEIYFPLNGYAGIGNDFIKLNKLVSALDGEQNVQNDILDHPENFKNSNRIRMNGTAFTILAYYVPDRLRGNWAFNAGIAERAEAGVVFPGDLMRLVLETDKAFAGQSKRISNIDLNGIYYREFFIGGTRKIFKRKNFSISTGGRVKFLWGIASVLTKNASVDFYMDKSAKYIDVNSNFDLYTSNILNSSLNPLNSNGIGMAFDGGVSFNLKDYTASLSVVDLGGIKFNKSLEHLQHSSSIHFEGFNPDEGFKGIKDDTIFNDLTVNRTPDRYKHFLNPRLNILFSWRSKEDDKILFNRTLVQYSKHRAYISLSGLLNEFRINELSNQLSIGYTYNWKDFFEIGPGFFAGGNARIGLGCMASIKYRCFTIGAATSNLFPLVTKLGKGTDISISSLFFF
ncbi:hypothetical protein MYP_2476 [Sporocytophaga myxococcoides]|uniref:DUF5723 domain-containing protein n=1 Tax=Sporocytophaga myxococcoides TaxID=153721 RepID=A0A098LFN6_9BACT|nr:DUF5723 family protein [Sporocytophaga myxococcoides]GAL85247.1 hypothetical protein MYP_2476 [Sporocytophaga myxococcoides]